jgi:uncharacterized LabA/DUF88 family protein
MARVTVFVDGFNLYHSINDRPNLRRYKWLDIPALVAQIYPHYKDVTYLYFTSLADWSPLKVAKHKRLIAALEAQGMKTTYGKFKLGQRRCRAQCRQVYVNYEEKETDVNIAISLVGLARDNAYDIALLLSGDSDQIPAIKQVKSLFPQKKVGAIIPIGRKTIELERTCHFHARIKERHLIASRLPDTVMLSNNSTVECPADWK